MSRFEKRKTPTFLVAVTIIIVLSLLSSVATNAITNTLVVQNTGVVAHPGAESSRLHTDGRWIKDVAGSVVRLKGSAIFWEFMYCSNYTDYNPLAYEDEINETSLNLFASTGANFLRLIVNGYLWYIKGAPKYGVAVDTVIGWCKVRGIMVALSNCGWWNPEALGPHAGAWYKTNDQLAAEGIEWKGFMVALAQRYRNESAVIGFDMLNEPTENLTWDVWRPNVLDVVQAVHAVDPTYLCFVEPLGSSCAIDDMNNFKTDPLPERNVVYCAHEYYAWNYPWFDYARNYASGNFELAREQMETLYYEFFIDMRDVNLPSMDMESGVYRNPSSNPNWNVWENDSLTLYEKYGVSVCWLSFDPDRSYSSLISILAPDRITLTSVGDIWAMHMKLD
jgi:hypothetical protein